jgi:hypothetical protein
MNETIKIKAVLEAASTDTRGVYLKIRVAESDAAKLLHGGAWNNTVMLVYEKEKKT